MFNLVTCVLVLLHVLLASQRSDTLKHLRVTLEIFEQYPKLLLRVLVLTDIENSGQHDELSGLLREAQAEVRRSLAGVTLSEHPRIASWREAYRAFGVKAKQYPSSIENLLKRVTKGEELRSINPLVDLYNVVSMRHLVPVGGEDIDALQGDLRLRIAGKDEPAIHLLGDREAKAPKPGEGCTPTMQGRFAGALTGKRLTAAN